MLIFQRKIETRIRELLFKGKMITLLGPRQAGKTTLTKKIIGDFDNDGAYFDCQLAEVRKHFVVGEPDKLLKLVAGKRIVAFDEAQTIQNIGSILKVFFDTYPQVQIIATGSSSFDLANKIKEPMTGRAFEFTLLPLSLEEIVSVKQITTNDIYEYMRLGQYPAVVGAETVREKEEAIKNISTNYLYKDIFVFEAIRNPKVFEDLLKLLAMHIGSMVSVNELAQSLGVTRTTVNRYMRLLEQSFIIKRIYSFSNNPRTELKKAFKVFFLDVGVRNSLVDILSPVESRGEKGAIFENFFIMERMKSGTAETFPPEIMFWRTRKGMEIDVIEKRGAAIHAYECKWQHENVKFTSFLEKYPNATVGVVTPESVIAESSGRPVKTPI